MKCWNNNKKSKDLLVLLLHPFKKNLKIHKKKKKKNLKKKIKIKSKMLKILKLSLLKLTLNKKVLNYIKNIVELFIIIIK